MHKSSEGMRRLGIVFGVVAAIFWVVLFFPLVAGVYSEGHFRGVAPAGWVVVIWVVFVFVFVVVFVLGVLVAFCLPFSAVWGIDWVVAGFRQGTPETADGKAASGHFRVRPRMLILAALAAIIGVTSVLWTLQLIANLGANADLRDAARVGHTETVRALLAAGADVNAKTPTGGTALMITARFGHPEIAQALIAAGADVNATDEDGKTALARATGGGHTEIVRVLLAAGAKRE